MRKKKFFAFSKKQLVLLLVLFSVALLSLLVTLTMMIIPTLMEYAIIPCGVMLIAIAYLILTLGAFTIQSLVSTVKRDIQARNTHSHSKSDRTI